MDPSRDRVSAGRVLDAVAGAHVSLCRAPQAVARCIDAKGEVVADWGRDADATTAFRIASMTKSFTAALVVALRDDGVLDLDRPVAVYAPELAAVVGPGPGAAPITVRHLLTMSSGLATDDPWADRHLDATDADLDGWIRTGVRFAHPTGTAFEYSNLGFALLGRVVHRVTGERVQSLVTRRLLEPLGMVRTAWSVEGLPQGCTVAPGWHPGPDEVLVPERPLGDGVVAPMGGLWSCAADLGTWVTFLSSAFGPHPLDGPLGPASRREMQQVHRVAPVRRVAAADGSVRAVHGGYGFGLVAQYDERLGAVISHSGGLPGYGSNMRWMPTGLAVVALANVTYAPMSHATSALLDALAHANVVAPPVAFVPEELASATTSLVGLLADWDPDRAEALFSDNVLLDEPAASRIAQAQRRFGGQVPAVLRVEAESGASAVATVAVAGDLLRLRVRLAPLADLRVQGWEWL